MKTRKNLEPTTSEIDQIIAGYVQMVEERMRYGFEAALLTFMFNPLSGTPQAVTLQMQRAIETIYAKHLTHVYRHPKRQPIMAMPFWISCPDWPVPKHSKDSFYQLALNDGQHSHAIALTPPFRRLRGSLTEHFDSDQSRYAGVGKPVFRLHAKPIEETPHKVTGYAMKSLGRRRTGLDEVLILPRSHSEMQTRISSLPIIA